MTRIAQSFSQKIKDELGKIPCPDDLCRQVELAACYLAAGRFSSRFVDLGTTQQSFSDRLLQLLEQQHSLVPLVRQGKETRTIRLERQAFNRTVGRDISSVLEGQALQDFVSRPVSCHRALLRALFLACGSISEPSAAYHLELAVRQENKAATAFKSVLDRLGFRTTLVRRDRYDVIFLREGQQLADFLLLAGAQLSLLDFESLRVEKEMRNSVNRVVNCDNANMQRVADAAARQLQLAFALEEAGLKQQLPADLLAAARARQENPDLTIKDLGELMRPPLGKSGMNHRLKKFEEKAKELLAGPADEEKSGNSAG